MDERKIREEAMEEDT